MTAALITALAIIGFVLLTAGTALFVAAEFSLTALEKSAVDNEAEHRGDRRSRLVQRAHRTLSFQLSGAQLGITITTLVTGYLAEPVLTRFLPLSGIWLAIIALVIATSLSMVFGELIPKNWAIAQPMRVARLTAGAMAAFSMLFSLVITSLNGTANWIVRRLGIEPAEELSSARSAQELSVLVRNSAKQGAIEPDTARLMERSLRFGDRVAEDLMTPRGKVETLAPSSTVLDLIQLADRTGFSRFPVIDGDLDETIGVVHVKQAFIVPAQRRAATTVGTICRRVPLVPASLDGDAVMEQIRTDGMQVAMVVDEYGGTAGIITMEDIVEEIVGDVRDEHDNEIADAEQTADGWTCAGLLRIDELTETTGYRAPEGEYDTLGGLIMSLVGEIPVEGDTVDLPPSAESGDDAAPRLRAEVVAMDGRRVDVVLLTVIAAEPDNDDASSEDNNNNNAVGNEAAVTDPGAADAGDSRG